MTTSGYLFIALGLAICIAFSVPSRSFLYAALFLYHLVVSVFYCNYSLSHSADSRGYYEYVGDGDDFGLGTAFINWLTAWLRDSLGASYLDLFMLFHLFGYLGIVLLYKLCLQIQADHSEDPDPGALVKVAVFLPGLHFWTSAIGKDSLIFFGIVAALWSMRQPRQRVLPFLGALALCTLIRPHMAAVLVGACALALASSRDIPLRWRIPGFAVLLLALWLAVPQLKDFLRLDEVSVDRVAEYVEQRQSNNLDGTSSVDISRYSFPLQFLTYMFRPLFFDASGALSMIVSAENLLYLGLCVYLTPAVLRTMWHGHGGFFTRLNFIFWFVSTAILASSTANMGIAIRQKTMVLPSLVLLLFTAYWSAAPQQVAEVPALASE